MLPDFLAIGHVSKDLVSGGFRLGGTATFAALTALRMGSRPAVVTSVSSDLDLSHGLAGILLHIVPSPETTTFLNTYHGGVRRQVLSAIARPLACSDIPDPWRQTPLVLLGPLGREVSYGLASHFPAVLLVASLQGWLRKWDDEGHVSPAYWDGRDLLSQVHVAIVSEEDIVDDSLVEVWKDLVPLLIVTMGKRGARLHLEGAWHHVKAFPAREVDSTGAGDVFIAAYMIRHRETGDPLVAARFASCAASLSVEAPGVEGIPTRNQIEARLKGNS